ncbi:MAG: DUF2842 domain-containing protein [Hyphomicrobiaceae bacterium]
MSQRRRKLFGTVALLVLIIVYSLLAMFVAIILQVNNANGLVELAYYVVAGLLWVVPAAAIISWMSKEDTTSEANNS